MQSVSTVDDYIAAQSPEVQPRFRALREAIRLAARDATEVISYGMQTYKQGGRRVHFAAANVHRALYGSAMDQFADELQNFKMLKGTVQFPLHQHVPQDPVRKLVSAKFGS